MPPWSWATPPCATSTPATPPSPSCAAAALIARDAAGLERLSELRVGEDYLVAGRIRLGTLLDLIATFLNSLDLLYDLYGESTDAGAATAVSAEATDNVSVEAVRLT